MIKNETIFSCVNNFYRKQNEKNEVKIIFHVEEFIGTFIFSREQKKEKRGEIERERKTNKLS